MADEEATIQTVAAKPKLQLPGSEAVRAYENRQRVKQQNLALLRMATMIYKRNAARRNGLMTRQKALEMAKMVMARKKPGGGATNSSQAVIPSGVKMWKAMPE